jgi:hypothetical protein
MSRFAQSRQVYVLAEFDQVLGRLSRQVRYYMAAAWSAGSGRFPPDRPTQAGPRPGGTAYEPLSHMRARSSQTAQKGLLCHGRQFVTLSDGTASCKSAGFAKMTPASAPL